ncbi:MAG: phytanoyl-CoA dioxygenase family protein, partial [Gammaproteobacteria bacterium]
MNSNEVSGSLTADQIEHFRTHRYVVVPGLYGATEMADIAAWVDEVQNWPETPGEHMMYFEIGGDDESGTAGQRLLNRVENVPPYHAGFRQLAKAATQQGACAQLFGEPAVLFKDKINFKMPGGGGFEPHQDVQAGWSRYADMHITALVTIDRATIENGCLEIATNFRDHDLTGRDWTPLTDEDLAGVDSCTIE